MSDALDKERVREEVLMAYRLTEMGSTGPIVGLLQKIDSGRLDRDCGEGV